MSIGPATLFRSTILAADRSNRRIYSSQTLDERLASWIGARVRAFECLQVAPKLVVPDNTKTGVTKACRYDPDLNHENIFVLGPTGVGKSFVACALAQKACRDGYSALYTRAQTLFRDLAMARADGSLRSLLARLSRIDVLVIDDWVMAPLSEPERRDFWEICEDRYQVRSMILTSQLPVSRWHEQIGDPTLADGVLDRLVHNAHRIEMRGDSMRKNRGKPNT